MSSVVLEFRVKFYASDPANLQEELTRYLFYKQVQKDLLDGRYVCSHLQTVLCHINPLPRMPCSLDSSTVLCAHSLQGKQFKHRLALTGSIYIISFLFCCVQILRPIFISHQTLFITVCTVKASFSFKE